MSLDEGSLEHVKSMFPELEDKDIVAALHHIHMRIYHRPFGGDDMSLFAMDEGSENEVE